MTRHTRRAHSRTISHPDIRKLALLLLSLCVSAVLALSARATEDDIVVSHGYSFFGELKYPADFEHFDYVNPDAPRGGEIAIAVPGVFESMNPYFREGKAAAFSSIMYESLMFSTSDSLTEYYGLIAHKIEYPKDRSWVIFHLRPEARFSDGTYVTAEDVVFSHKLLLEQGLPSYRDGVSKLIPKVEALDDHRVKFYFTDGVSRRGLIEISGNTPVWSKDWYEETGARLDEPRIETSPGSGPYVVHKVDVNRRVIYKLNPDYWGWDLPVNKGRHNFDEVRLEYFADATAAFEAFKAGEVNYRRERDPKLWASSYDFPSVENGYVIKKQLPNGNPPPMTGIVFNTRSDVFKDKRVREAVTLMFNFEWKNNSLYSDLFKQQRSYSTGTSLEATGLPEGSELEFFNSLGDLVPEEIYTDQPWTPHESRPGKLTDRRNKGRALDILAEVGYEVDDAGVMRGQDGKPLKIVFLFNSTSPPTEKSVAENFVANVRELGIEVVLDSVDDSQYTKRERDKDYDLVYDGYPALRGTGQGLAQRLGSDAAVYSLFNPASYGSELVDEIIARSLLTDSQAEEDMTVRALDRVLRSELLLIPEGYAPDYWVAVWDVFGHPETLPPFELGTLDFWWYDADKAQKLEDAGAL